MFLQITAHENITNLHGRIGRRESSVRALAVLAEGGFGSQHSHDR